MNKYIYTRPLFDEICDLQYCRTMDNRIKRLKITDFRITESHKSKHKTGIRRVDYCMTREDWERVKASLNVEG